MNWKKLRQRIKITLLLIGLPTLLLANTFPIYYSDTTPAQESNSFSLDNNMFGIQGPLSIGTTYSQQYGVILKAQFTQLLNETNAISVLTNAGAGQRRLNVTWANQLSEHQQIKLSAERLWQRMDFDFASGDVNQWVGQNAAGATYAYWFNKSWLSDINANISYSKADSKNLSSIDFEQNGIEYEDLRHIAGGTDKSTSIGFDTLPTKTTQLGFQVDYDNVHYNSRYENTATNTSGLGLTINLEQLISKKIKIDFLGSDRKTYNQYGMQFGFILPSPNKTNLELDLGAQRTLGHEGLPNDTAYTANVDFRWGNVSNNDGFSLAHDANSQDLKSWTAQPAVQMDQVLAVKDEKLVQINPAQNPSSAPIQTNNQIVMVPAKPNQNISIDLTPYFSATSTHSNISGLFYKQHAIQSTASITYSTQNLPSNWHITNNILMGTAPNNMSALQQTDFTITSEDNANHPIKTIEFKLISTAANGCGGSNILAPGGYTPPSLNIPAGSFSITIGNAANPIDAPTSATNSYFTNFYYGRTSPYNGRINAISATGSGGITVSSVSVGSLPNSIQVSGNATGNGAIILVAKSTYCQEGSDPKTLNVTVGSAPPVVSNPGNQTVQIGTPQTPISTANVSITNPGSSGNLNNPTVTYDGVTLSNNTYNSDGIKYTYSGSTQSGSMTFSYNGSSPTASATTHNIVITSSNTASSTPTTVSFQLTILPAAQAPNITNPGNQTVQIGAAQIPIPTANVTINNASGSGQLNDPTVTYDGVTLSNDTYNTDGVKYTYTGSAQTGSMIFSYNGTSPAASAKVHTITITSTNTASKSASISYQLTILPAAQAPSITNPGNQTVQIGVPKAPIPTANVTITNTPDSGQLNEPTVTYDGVTLSNDTYNADGIKYKYTGSAQTGSMIFSYNGTSPAASATAHTITITSSNTASKSASISYQLTILPAAQAPSITNPGNQTVQIGIPQAPIPTANITINNAADSGELNNPVVTYDGIKLTHDVYNSDGVKYTYTGKEQTGSMTFSYNGNSPDASAKAHTITITSSNTASKSDSISYQLTILSKAAGPVITRTVPASVVLQNTIAEPKLITYTIENAPNSGEIEQNGLHFYLNNDTSKHLPSSIAIHEFTYDTNTRIATVVLSYDGTPLTTTDLHDINLIATNTVGKSSEVSNVPLTIAPAPAAPSIKASPSTAQIQDTIAASDFVTYTIQNAPYSGVIDQSGLRFYINGDTSQPLPTSITIHRFSYNPTTNAATVTLSYDGSSLSGVQLNKINLVATNSMDQTSAVHNEPVNILPIPQAPVIQNVTPATAQIQNTVAAADFVTYTIKNAENSGTIQQSGLHFYINNDTSKPLPTGIAVHQFSYDASTRIATVTLSYDGTLFSSTDLNTINLVVTNSMRQSSAVNNEPITILPAPSSTHLYCPSQIDTSQISAKGEISLNITDSKGKQYTLQGSNPYWLAGYKSTPMLYDVYINAAAVKNNLTCEYVVKKDSAVVGTFQLAPTPATPSNGYFSNGSKTWCQADPNNPEKCRINWNTK